MNSNYLMREDFQLEVSVPDFELRKINGEDVIFFKIAVVSYINEKDWIVYRRFSEFHDLYLFFEKYFINIPKLPNKTLTKMKNYQDIQLRRQELDKFIKEVIERPDCINFTQTIEFLELENHFRDINLYQPMLLYEISDFPMEINAMYFCNENSLLFIAYANTSIKGKISAYFSSFFESKQKQETNYEKCFGALAIYHMTKSNGGEVHLEQIHLKILEAQPTCLNYLVEENILSVGCKDGTIYIFKIYSRESAMVSKELVSQICKFKAHSARIINTCINFNTGYIYSCANDKNLTISEMNYGTVVKSYPISKYNICGMSCDEENKKIFLADESGSIIIVTYENVRPTVLQAFHMQINKVSSFSFDTENRMLFVGNSEGVIAAFDIDCSNEMNVLLNKKLDLHTQTTNKITCIANKHAKNELIVSNQFGSVSFWSHSDYFPEYVLSAHSKELTCFHWDDKSKLLITASYDRFIRCYQLPLYWPSEQMRKHKDVNEKSVLTFCDNILKIKKSFSFDDDKSLKSGSRTARKTEEDNEGGRTDRSHKEHEIDLHKLKISEDKDEKEEVETLFDLKVSENLQDKKSRSLCKEKVIKVNAKYLDPTFDDLLGWDYDNDEESKHPVRTGHVRPNLTYLAMI